MKPNIVTVVEAKSTPAGSEMTLYGDIGVSMFSEGITAKQVAAELKKCKGPLNVFLNSPGGSVFEGLAIFSQLQRYEGGVTMHVDGFAASIASVIMLAGKKVCLTPASMVMIHQPFAAVAGNPDELEKMAADLRKIGSTIVGIYESRTKLPAAKLITLMDEETWFSAEDAVKLGFADEVTGSEPKNAAPTILDTFKRTPDHLRTTPAALAQARMEMALLRTHLRRSPMTPGGSTPSSTGTDK